MTYELTGAITDVDISLGFMQLNAVLPGSGFEYAGARCRTFMRHPPGDFRSSSGWWSNSLSRVRNLLPPRLTWKYGPSLSDGSRISTSCSIPYSRELSAATKLARLAVFSRH